MSTLADGFNAPLGQAATGGVVTTTAAVQVAKEPIQCVNAIFDADPCWMEAILSTFPYAETTMLLGLIYTSLKLVEHFRKEK